LRPATSFIATIEAELASVRSRIAALEAEEADLEAAMRVFARLNEANSAAHPAADDEGAIPALKAEVASRAASADLSRAKPVVEAVAGSAMSEGSAVAESPETAETGSRLDAGRTASATSEAMDATGGESAATSHATGKPGDAPNDASPAPSIASRLRALNAKHPELTTRDVSERLGLTLVQVRTNSHVHKLEWASGDRRRVSQRAAEPVQPRSPAPAPEPSPQPERPPLQARAPVAAQPSGSGSAVVSTPMRRAPRGQQFWLRNEAGEYLNRYCTGFTRDRREAWSGSQDQLAACRRHFAIAVDLVERPVEREQARAVA
jgi:hypothetical protein